MSDYEIIANLRSQDAAEQRLDRLHDDLAALVATAADDDDWPPSREQMLDLVDRLSNYAGTPNEINDPGTLNTVIWALATHLRRAPRS